jgi:hypothetical protein
VHHLEVEQRALLQPLRLDQLAGARAARQPRAQLLADLVDRLMNASAAASRSASKDRS